MVGVRGGRISKAVNPQHLQYQLQSLRGFETWLNRREVRELPNILRAGENVIGFVPGLYRGGSGLLVATDQRLIFIDKGTLGMSLKIEDFGYDRVTSIQYDGGMLLGKIVVHAAGVAAEITHLPKDQSRYIADAARNLMSRPAPAHIVPPPVSVAAPPRVDPVAEIERLAGLRDRGLLTDDEFTTAKGRLLGTL